LEFVEGELLWLLFLFSKFRRRPLSCRLHSLGLLDLYTPVYRGRGPEDLGLLSDVPKNTDLPKRGPRTGMPPLQQPRKKTPTTSGLLVLTGLEQLAGHVLRIVPTPDAPVEGLALLSDRLYNRMAVTRGLTKLAKGALGLDAGGFVPPATRHTMAH
jgi:hypothetical protein